MNLVVWNDDVSYTFLDQDREWNLDLRIEDGILYIDRFYPADNTRKVGAIFHPREWDRVQAVGLDVDIQRQRL